MNEREVLDENNLNWKCVQALVSIDDEKTNNTSPANSSGGDNQVDVVCTPSGQAQSVRIKLPPDWLKSTADDDLLRAIEKARHANGR